MLSVKAIKANVLARDARNSQDNSDRTFIPLEIGHSQMNVAEPNSVTGGTDKYEFVAHVSFYICDF